ncbi:unnamed protein product [Pleuronectes platessa]|uniref:Uncharacterized protein n=1 Tax=Pleuronectes platessa TaxID=8262 RepID=A0A9N7VG57_PLEPL|nr:unnamed protein product [Pleuronectes platessa]
MSTFDTGRCADFFQQRRQDESPSRSRRASSASEGQHPEVREKLVEQRCPGKKPTATLTPAFVRPRGAAFSQEVVETYSWLRPDELIRVRSSSRMWCAPRGEGVVAQTLDVRFKRSGSRRTEPNFGNKANFFGGRITRIERDPRRNDGHLVNR